VVGYKMYAKGVGHAALVINPRGILMKEICKKQVCSVTQFITNLPKGHERCHA